MIDLLAAHMALRNRALSLVVAATGSISLSATTSGYHRADAGSFLGDGFYAGMEITPAGFASNPVDILVNVTASDLTTQRARAAEVAAGSRSIAVGLPALRAFENFGSPFKPIAGRPYFAEEFTHDTASLLGTRNAGYVEETGLYIAKWYDLAGYDVGAIRTSVDRLKALFAPGTSFTIGSNDVHVRSDVSVRTGQLLPVDGGWSLLTLTVPWYALSNNVIAA